MWVFCIPTIRFQLWFQRRASVAVVDLRSAENVFQFVLRYDFFLGRTRKMVERIFRVLFVYLLLLFCSYFVLFCLY
jgi:hypothetical protein